MEVVRLDDLGDAAERLAVGELDAEPLGPLPRPVRRDRLLDDGQFEEAVARAVAARRRGGFEGDVAGASAGGSTRGIGHRSEALRASSEGTTGARPYPNRRGAAGGLQPRGVSRGFLGSVAVLPWEASARGAILHDTARKPFHRLNRTRMITDVQKHLPAPSDIRSIISRHLLTDGFKLVLDMEKSQGLHLHDAATGKDYVDFFTFFASNPLGMNHPKLRNDEGFIERLLDAAINKVSNSDVYTGHLARFVDTFSRVGIPDELPHAFFVSGGALAVENALKTAFDWKVRKNFQKGHRTERGHQVMHFEQAFHGRSGYTMSLTNTDPTKVALFPKFDWPRVLNPKMNGPEYADDIEQREALAIRQAKMYFQQHPDDIACHHHRADPGRGRRQPLPPELPPSSSATSPTRTTRFSSSTRCRRASG